MDDDDFDNYSWKPGESRTVDAKPCYLIADPIATISGVNSDWAVLVARVALLEQKTDLLSQIVREQFIMLDAIDDVLRANTFPHEITSLIDKLSKI